MKVTTRFDQNNWVVVHSTMDEPIKDDCRVHIWLSDLDDDSQIGSWDSLSATEHARVVRLKSSLERKRMTNRFIFTRKVIGNLAGISLDGWEFSHNSHGKPAPLCLVDGKGNITRLHFNISHSENILALAVLMNRNIGIDVEVVRPEIDFLSVAKLHFDPESLQMLCSVQPSKISQLFYRLWTRKEALAKLEGVGIAQQSTKILTDMSQSLFSFEFEIGKKKIIGACACETL